MKSENPRLIIEIEKRTADKKTGQISFQFRIGPFKKSMATTIGSALRRTLLSLSKTVSITSGCANFSEGNCLREDLFELSLNLQRVQIKSCFYPYLGTARITKKGPAIITAQDLHLDEGLEVVNPYQYICSVNENYNLDLCLMISSPNFNQTVDPIDPLNNFTSMKKNYLIDRENQMGSIFEINENSFFTNHLEKINASQSRTSEILTKQKKIIANSTRSKLAKNSKIDTFSASIKDNNLKIDSAKKLPKDIVLVDPIYSSIQSCGFETIQTTISSVGEYEELIKRGITDTDEFLRFIVVSRGAIEPVLAIDYSIRQLQENFSVLQPLPHVFASQKNIFLALEKGAELKIENKSRKNINTLYTSEIIKKLDIKHLNLTLDLEVLLRRQGFTDVKSLVSVPLEFFRRIGIEQNDLRKIEKSLNVFGLTINFNKNLKWELLPSSLP